MTDDDRVFAQAHDALELGGFVVFRSHSIAEALTMIRLRNLALVIADASLITGVGGMPMEVATDAGIGFIAVVGSDEAGLEWLERGASDFVTTPIDGRELLARARLRNPKPPRGIAIEFEELVIDLTGRMASVGDVIVDLTAREFDLLAYMAARPNTAFTREELLEAVWSSSSDWQSVDTVTEHVYRLRHKLDPHGSKRRWIVTVRGRGYRFVPKSSDED